MTQSFENPLFRPVVVHPFLERIKALYAAMDEAYTLAAAHYGFQCDGCVDNCCMTRFHHHTLIEYHYLMVGVGQLSKDQRGTAEEKARRVVAETRRADERGGSVRLMCPLNQDQLCLIYPWRPMICRLHGISHLLRRNDGAIIRGQGCGLFDEQTRGRSDYGFDRTPFYQQMALLEREVRQATGITRKIKMTIAEMLISGILESSRDAT